MPGGALTSFPLRLVRQQNEPLDIDSVFATTAARNSYLTNPRRYAGQVAADLETDTIYYLNQTATAWLPMSPFGKEKLMFVSDGSYVLPVGYMIDKILITPSSEDSIKVGLTNGGEEIMFSETIAGGNTKIVSYDIVAKTATKTIYFTGITDTCEVIIYLRLL